MERLLLVTAPRPDLVAHVDRALAGVRPGTTLVQLRDRSLSGRALYELAATLVSVAHHRGARVVVNDRVDVALAAGADGVHLPEAGMAVEDARALLPPGSLVGRSLHAAAATSADYVVVGPIWDTPGKAAAGLVRLRDVVCALPGTPVFAIGGVDVARADEAAAAGAAGVAVIRAVMDAADPGPVAAALVEVFLSR